MSATVAIDSRTTPQYTGSSLSDMQEEPEVDYKKWKPSDWGQVLVMMFFVCLCIALAVLGMVLAYEGRRKYNSIEDDANALTKILQDKSALDNPCFNCIEGVQSSSAGVTPQEGVYTLVFNAPLHLTKDAAKNTHFPGGFQIPGMSFGLPAPGGFEYNTPVIISRGMSTNNTQTNDNNKQNFQYWDGASLFGQPGLTSMAHITKSTSVQNRCYSLYTETYTADPNGVFSQVPMYILFDDSPSASPKYYLCMCIFNLDPSATVGMESDYERCVPMTPSTK